MIVERHVRLFRNGRNQALRIPRDLELPGRAATLGVTQRPAAVCYAGAQDLSLHACRKRQEVEEECRVEHNDDPRCEGDLNGRVAQEMPSEPGKAEFPEQEVQSRCAVSLLPTRALVGGEFPITLKIP
jgi:hypothetical protein